MTHDAAAEVMEVFCYGWGSAMIKQQRYEDGLLSASQILCSVRSNFSVFTQAIWTWATLGKMYTLLLRLQFKYDN